MQKVFGGLLIATGILVAGLSGLCTFFMFAESASPETFSAESIGIVAIFGGIPFATGITFILLGRYLIKNASES